MGNFIKDTDPFENFTDKKQAKKNDYNWNCINGNIIKKIKYIINYKYHIVRIQKIQLIRI